MHECGFRADLYFADAFRHDRLQSLSGMAVKDRGKSVVGDVVTERLESKLACFEDDRRRAEQSVRGIDNADCLEGSCVRRKLCPNAEALQKIDRARKQRSGPRVALVRG